MNKIPVENMVVFCILMEGHEGIVGKAPSYLSEKWEMIHSMENPQVLLDLPNTRKFEQWKKTWASHLVKK